jgi:hypothetical protein
VEKKAVEAREGEREEVNLELEMWTSAGACTWERTWERRCGTPEKECTRSGTAWKGECARGQERTEMELGNGLERMRLAADEELGTEELGEELGLELQRRTGTGTRRSSLCRTCARTRQSGRGSAQEQRQRARQREQL